VSLFAQPHSARPPGTAPAPGARWLALGDSYTCGEGVAPESRWPVLLTARLRAGGATLEPPRLVATTGWTTDEQLAGMESARVWPAHQRFDLVSLLIGVNDQYRGRAFADFGRGYSACLERAVALAGGHAARVLCLSIPDWGVTPFAAGRDRAAIARDIDRYNAFEESRASASGAHWCGVTALSRRHGDDAACLAADGLHPGPAAYAEWAAAALPAARAALAGLRPGSS
jgi:lysophospholipase L1-like esterase